MSQEITTKIWDLYNKGIDYINKINLVNKTDKCHRFFNGDQWHGIKADNEELPILNFIKGVVKYKVATVAQNTMSAIFSPMDNGDAEAIKACEALNKHFSIMWERSKMDSLSWKIIKDACIQADGYIFFGKSDVSEGQLVDNVNVLLGDEQNSNIQAQPYIIIAERRFIKDMRKEAKSNGISKEQIELIVSDNERSHQLGDKMEIDYNNDEGKGLSLLYLYKDDKGFVHIARSTKYVEYQPDTILTAKDPNDETATPVGLKRYPLVNYTWEDKKGSARGCGEVEFLIPNQLELNKTLARRVIAVKQCAFPKIAYLENSINNPDEIDLIGAKIGIKDGNAQNIQNYIAYLNPAVVSPDARNLSDELMTESKELAGAGDAAMGQVDPTQASGNAIIATRDQAALPLNEQIAKYRQFVEDLALLWYDIWVAYNPNGLSVQMDDNQTMTISPELLARMKVNVRIDVSQNNPFSKYAQEQSLISLLSSQHISFEEFIDALDDGSVTPKGKLKDIINKRQAQVESEEKVLIEQQQQEIAKLTDALNQSTNILSGGGQNAMQSM